MMVQNNNDMILPDDENESNDAAETTGEDLKFNEEEGSFELDPEVGESDYQHPLPYDTAAPLGEDDNSTYDEENPYTQNEYQDKRDKLNDDLLHLDEEVVDESVQLDEIDEQLAEGQDEPADETDEEGYPLRDDAGGTENPIF